MMFHKCDFLVVPADVWLIAYEGTRVAAHRFAERARQTVRGEPIGCRRPSAIAIDRIARCGTEGG
jgi:hypothetical protein